MDNPPEVKRLKSLEDIINKLIGLTIRKQVGNNNKYGSMIARYNAIYRDLTGNDYRGIEALKKIDRR